MSDTKTIEVDFANAACALIDSLTELLRHADRLTEIRASRLVAEESLASGYKREALEQTRDTMSYLGLVQRLRRGLAALPTTGSSIQRAAAVHVRHANLLLACMSGGHA